MEPIDATSVADVPRERVYELISDLSIRPAFTDHFLCDLRLIRLDPRGVGAGLRFRVAAGAQPWCETVITAAERPYRIVEAGSMGRGNRIPTHTVWELTEGPGTLTTIAAIFRTEPSHPVDRLNELLAGRRWTQRQWDRATRRLAAIAESDRWPPSRIGVAGGDPLRRLPVGVR